MSRLMYWLMMAVVVVLLMTDSCALDEYGSDIIKLRGEAVTGVVEALGPVEGLSPPCEVGAGGKVVAYQADRHCSLNSVGSQPCRNVVPFKLRLDNGEVADGGQDLRSIITPEQAQGPCGVKVLRHGQRVSLTSEGGLVGYRYLAFTGTPQEAEALVLEASWWTRLRGRILFLGWVLLFWAGLWRDPHVTAARWATAFSPYTPPVFYEATHSPDEWLYLIRRGGLSGRLVVCRGRILWRLLMLALGSGALLWFLVLARFTTGTFVALMAPSLWPVGADPSIVLHLAAIVWVVVVAVGVAGVWAGQRRGAPGPTARAERALRLLAPHLTALASSKSPIQTTLRGWCRLGAVSWSCEVPIQGGALKLTLTTHGRARRANLWRRSEDAPEPCDLKVVWSPSSKGASPPAQWRWLAEHIAQGLSPEGGEVGQWLRGALAERGVAVRDVASFGGAGEGAALIWGAGDAREAPSTAAAPSRRRAVALRSVYEEALKTLEGAAKGPGLSPWYWWNAACVVFGFVSLIVDFAQKLEVTTTFPMLAVMGSLWASAIYLPRLLSSPESSQDTPQPLWIDAGGLQRGEVSVSWAESPEEVQWRVSRGRGDQRGRAWLNVELRRRGASEALRWRVPVLVEGAEALPVLDERGPVMSARDFHDHVWPALRWLAALKGEPLPPVRLAEASAEEV